MRSPAVVLSNLTTEERTYLIEMFAHRYQQFPEERERICSVTVSLGITSEVWSAVIASERPTAASQQPSSARPISMEHAPQ